MHGTYEKDGRQKVAYTPSEAVELRFNGWARIDEPTVDEEPTVEAVEVTDTNPAPVPPPMAGKGSGTDEWVTYADQFGLTFEGDPKRDDVIEALRVAGHPVDRPDQQ